MAETYKLFAKRTEFVGEQHHRRSRKEVWSGNNLPTMADIVLASEVALSLENEVRANGTTMGIKVGDKLRLGRVVWPTIESHEIYRPTLTQVDLIRPPMAEQIHIVDAA